MNLTVCPVLKVLFVYLSVSLSANCSFVCRPKPDPRGPWAAPTPPMPYPYESRRFEAQRELAGLEPGDTEPPWHYPEVTG